MIQKAECEEYIRHDRRLRFLDFLDDGDSIWFCGFHTRGLFRFDKATGKTRLACLLPSNTVHESYRAICKKDGKLYIAPVFANSIVIFDMDSGEVKELPLVEQSDRYRRMPSGGQENFAQMYVFEKYVFFVPFSFGAILRLDTDTDTLEYFDDFVNLLLPIVNHRDAFWLSGSCMVGDKLYLPSCCANALIVFDLRSCTSTLHRLEGETVGYGSISYDGKDFWILDIRGSRVLVWNEGEGVVDNIPIDASPGYHVIFQLGDSIWRISSCGDLTCTLINRMDHEISRVRLQVEEDARWSISKIFKQNDAGLCIKIVDEKILAYLTKRDSLCVFDRTGKCLSEYIFEICPEDESVFTKTKRERFGALAKREDGTIFLSEDCYEMNLPAFLDYIANTDLQSVEESSIQKNTETGMD